MADDKPAAAPAAPPPVVEQALEKIEKRPGERVAMTKGGVALQNLADLMAFAKMAVVNNAAPKGMNEGQAAIAIAVGLERGLGAMGGLQALVIINGVVSWRGHAALGMIQQSGLLIPGTLQSWTEGTIEDGTAVGICRAHRIGYPQPFVRKFSLKDAKVAGLWGPGAKDGPWKTRPTNMLEWRAVGDLARFHFSEALAGIPIAEDVEAGGIGPAVTVSGGEMPAEKPASSDPPVVIHDPILERFGVGTTAPEIVVKVDPKIPPTEVAFVNKDGKEVGRITNLAAPAGVVDAEVVQAEFVDQSAVTTVEDLVGDALDSPPLSQPPKADPFPPSAHAQTRNCKAPLNAMGGCDVCGWPGKDLR
jgi:hypothetical protein